MLRTLLKVRRVTWSEWGDLARAQLALLTAQLSVFIRSRGELLDRAVSIPPGVLSRSDVTRAHQLGWAVTRAARHGIFRPKCLTRSVALQRLLSRQGISGSAIRIGVRPEATGLNAHAWVTLNDMVIGDDPQFVSRFTPIAQTEVANLA